MSGAAHVGRERGRERREGGKQRTSHTSPAASWFLHVANFESTSVFPSSSRWTHRSCKNGVQRASPQRASARRDRGLRSPPESTTPRTDATYQGASSKCCEAKKRVRMRVRGSDESERRGAADLVAELVVGLDLPTHCPLDVALLVVDRLLVRRLGQDELPARLRVDPISIETSRQRSAQRGRERTSWTFGLWIFFRTASRRASPSRCPSRSSSPQCSCASRQTSASPHLSRSAARPRLTASPCATTECTLATQSDHCGGRSSLNSSCTRRALKASVEEGRARANLEWPEEGQRTWTAPVRPGPVVQRGNLRDCDILQLWKRER